MIQTIYYVFFYLTCIYGTYFLLTGFFGFIKKKKRKVKIDKNYKFAIIVAARNEEMVIGNLVDSLKNQNYDKSNYEVDVVVNNCTDNTEKAAKERGANIMRCTVPVKSKGDVLKWTFEKLSKRKDIDAYIIFDADNVVHPDFLKYMNITLNDGFKVAQGFRDSKNITDNWLSGSYSLFYYTQNFFFNKSRRMIGLSASINGTGFMIKKSLIDEKGFNTVTLTEDVEFTGICALNGEKIEFVEKAITYDEQPVLFKQSWTQRKRWSAGNLQCFNHYKKNLIKTFFKTGNMSCLDMLLVYMAPIVQVMSFVLMIVLAIFNFTGVILNDLFSFMFSQGILFLMLSYGMGMLFAIFVLSYYKKNVFSNLSGIMLFAVFFISWIPINIVCLFNKKIVWEPIKHERSVDIKGVLTK